MKASLSTTQKPISEPISSVKFKKISKSPRLLRGNMINIDMSEASEHTSSPSIIGRSRNNGDNSTPKHSQQSSNMLSGQPEAWKSRLFRQALKRSQSSSSDEIAKTGIIAPVNPITLPVDEVNLNLSRLTLNPKESFHLQQPHRKVDNFESSDTPELPCEALTISRGGENPVVYGKWFDFNDDIVTEVSCENFKNVFEGLECAYMLFYKRTG